MFQCQIATTKCKVVCWDSIEDGLESEWNTVLIGVVKLSALIRCENTMNNLCKK